MLNTPWEVLPGVWQITLPLPFELNSVNVYLVKLGDGWMLVDCGLGSAESLEELLAQLAVIGIPPPAITEIFLTHTHPDHVGQASRLLKLTGARLSMHRDELDQLLKVARSGEKPLWLNSVLERAGVPAELVSRIERSFDKIRANFQDLSPDTVLEGNEILQTAIGPLQLVLTPGHSPGHLCLYSPERGVLFAGDHLLQKITPNIGWLPGRDALADFFSSLERVIPMELECVLPGHGSPFAGHREWAVQTRRHHEERCERILSALRAGLRSAHALVSDLWARPLAPFHHRFAVFEVLAHLEYLRRREQVFEEPSDGVLLWRV